MGLSLGPQNHKRPAPAGGQAERAWAAPKADRTGLPWFVLDSNHSTQFSLCKSLSTYSIQFSLCWFTCPTLKPHLPGTGKLSRNPPAKR
jgi:hypothetical protein